MRFPSECYQIHQTLRQTMPPHLGKAQSNRLALRTFGPITAQSGCRSAVIAAMTFTGGFSAVRRRLREWLYDGDDRAAPSPNQIQWQRRKTRRADPARVERRLLVSSVATLPTLAFGGRAEDAQSTKLSPSARRATPKTAPERNRLASVFRLGLSTLSRLPRNGGMRRGVRLLPDRGRLRRRA